MAGAYQAGTVFVDVVPSMKGFFREVGGEVKSQMPGVGQDAGKSFVEGFKRQASASGKDVADAFADPLGKSSARLRQEAQSAGRALAAAQDEVSRAAQDLAAARSREEAAANGVEAAERALEAVRSRGSAGVGDVAAAEARLAEARERSTAANRAADDAAGRHSAALREAKTATDKLQGAQALLDAQTGRAPAQGAKVESALRGYRREASEAERATRSLEASAARAGGGFTSLRSMAQQAIGPMLALTAAVGIGGFVGEAIQASDATNKFAATLQFAGVAEDQIQALTAASQAYADATVYDLADIQGITAQLAANNVEGFDRLAEAAGNLNAVAGGTKDTYKSLGLALVQVNGAGKLQAQDWNQIANAVPGASGKIQQALAAMGAYTGNFRDAMAQGQISAEEFNQALLELGSDGTAIAAASDLSRIENAAGNLQATIVGGLKDAIDYMKPAITGAMNWLSDVIGGFFSWVKDNQETVKLFGIAVTAWAGAFGALTIINSVVGWVKGLTFTVEALNKALAANWISIIAVAIAGLVAWMVHLYESSEDFRAKVQEIGAVFQGIWETVIQPVFEAVWGWINDTLIPGIESIGKLLFQGDFDGNLFGLDEDSMVVDVLLTARDAVVEVAQTIGDVWSGVVQPALGAVWDWITGTLVPGIVGVWDTVLRPVIEGVGSAISLAWAVAQPVLEAMWTLLTQVLGPALQILWENVLVPMWQGFSDAVGLAWSVIEPVLQTLAGFFSDTLMPALWDFWTGVVQPVFEAVSTAIMGAWEYFIKPVFDILTATLGGVVGVAFTILQGTVETVFGAIWNTISTAWNIISGIFDGIVGVIRGTLGPVFQWLYDNIIKPIWDAIGDKIQAVVSVITDTIFPALQGAMDGIKAGFETFKSAIETAFNAIKAVAVAPINFVIETVYRDGIKWAFDSIAGAIGLDIRLPDVEPIAYATGGQFSTMTPGYTPGRDVYTFYSPDGGGALRLSGGEGIIRPDALRALGGKKWLDRVNASKGVGLADVGDYGDHRGQVAFADGGIWGAITGGFSAAWNWVKDTASAVADIISDPIGAVVNLIIKPAKDLLFGSEDDPFWVKAVRHIPTLLFDGIKSFFVSETEKSGLAGGEGLVGAARGAIGVPYVWGGSSIPPGLDCSGLVYWAAQQLGWGWPRLTAAGYQSASTPISWADKVPGDLLFWGSPAYHVAIYSGGSSMVEEPQPGGAGRETSIWGSPTVGRYGGAAKYDRGGWLTPGVTAAVNQTGQREAVLTAQQWRDVSALAAAQVASQAAGAQAGAGSLDGAVLRLVVDGREFNAHIEGISAGVLARRKQLSGRSR